MWRVPNLLQNGQRVVSRCGQNSISGVAEFVGGGKEETGDRSYGGKREKSKTEHNWRPKNDGLNVDILVGAGAVLGTACGHGLFQLTKTSGEKRCLAGDLWKEVLSQSHNLVHTLPIYSLKHSVLPTPIFESFPTAPFAQLLSPKSWLETTEIGIQTEPQSARRKDEVKTAERQFEQTVAEYESTLHNVIGVDMMKEKMWQEGFSHFLKASSQYNNPRALYNLGICHQKGYGTPQSLEKAVGYWREAADQGHGDACYQLGVCHLRGLGGLTADTETGRTLMSVASQAGVSEAKTYLTALSSNQQNAVGTSPSIANASSKSSPVIELEKECQLLAQECKVQKTHSVLYNEKTQLDEWYFGADEKHTTQSQSSTESINFLDQSKEDILKTSVFMSRTQLPRPHTVHDFRAIV